MLKRQGVLVQSSEPNGNTQLKGKGKGKELGQGDGPQPTGRVSAQKKSGPVWKRTQAEARPSVSGPEPLFPARTQATLPKNFVPPVEATTPTVTSTVHGTISLCNYNVLYSPNASKPGQKGATVVAGTSITSKQWIRSLGIEDSVEEVANPLVGSNPLCGQFQDTTSVAAQTSLLVVGNPLGMTQVMVPQSEMVDEDMEAREAENEVFFWKELEEGKLVENLLGGCPTMEISPLLSELTTPKEEM